MATLTPKQKEIRLRDARILDTAFPMIHDGGLNAVRLESIAESIGCTRGTIYNHYANKEDIVVALAVRSVRRRMEMFRCAISLSDCPRLSCAAVGISAEIYADLLPNDFAVEQMTRHDPVWHKTSPARQQVLQECEQSCIELIGNLIASAINCGDLSPPAGTKEADLVQTIVFGLWSLVYGGLVLEATSPSLPSAGITNSRMAIRRNCNALLDSYQWQPLFDAKTYNAWVKQITPTLTKRAKALEQTTVEEES